MRFFFIIFAALLMTASAYAFDPALNRDPLPCARPCQQVDQAYVDKWVEGAGIDLSEKTLTRDILQLFIGIKKPLNKEKDVNLNIQTGTGLYTGITF